MATPGSGVMDNQMAVMQSGGTQPMSGTISLSNLIDLIIQRTYHELTVLSELLPRKTDMERKIEILQFANRTRQLFVRLLALIRWTNSASKVDKCARISSFLNTQQYLFVETADMLSRLARETLVHARLPSFSLPCAVDVLTTGSYPRLPACIREKIIPPQPITPQEKSETLRRISQIIEHRVVMTDLQHHMCKPTIDGGRVKFRVDHEFEVTLTLMGEGAGIPWRLLDIEMLVEDPESVDGRQALVHSLQINYIHQIIQSRLIDSPRPLHDLYNTLHSFCQSLQLEVLHSQAQSLIRQRLGEYVRVEEYALGKSLVLSYWRVTIKKEGRPYQQQYKLTVHVDEADSSKPLQITHFPQIQGSERTNIPHCIQNDQLSIEKYLVQTVQVRSHAKLKDLEIELRLIVSAPCIVRGSPSVLYVPVLSVDCLDSEMLSIAVDVMKGSFLVSLALSENSLTSEIEHCLNADRKDLRQLLTNLRCWLMLERCRRSLQHLQVSCYDRLPLVNQSMVSQGSSSNLNPSEGGSTGGQTSGVVRGSAQPLDGLSKHKLFVKLPLQTDYYLVVEVVEVKDKRPKSCEYRYHLLKVKGEEGGETGGTSLDGTQEQEQQLFIRVDHMVQLDTALSTRGTASQLLQDWLNKERGDALTRKRKLLFEVDATDLPSSHIDSVDKRNRLDNNTTTTTTSVSYLVPQLTHLVALCTERLPLVALADELERCGVAHSGIQVDGDGVGLSLSLTEAPPCSLDNAKAARSLKSSLFSFTFRMLRRERAVWQVEIVLTNAPIRSTALSEQGSEQRVYLSFDKVGTEPAHKIINWVLEEWNSLAQLYSAVLNFAHYYNTDVDLQKDIEVKSYAYKRLTLAYGPNKSFVVHIGYVISEHRFNVSFGTLGHASTSNCHSLVATYLQRELDRTKSISKLAKTLKDSWFVLMTLGKLNTIPVIYIKSKPTLPQPTFTVLPESAVHYRVMYRGQNCLDVRVHSSRTVMIRDGGFSVFDSGKAVDGINPIPGLQSFLSQFVDETVSSSQARRLSTVEDDNPPSPVGMDTLESLLAMPALGGNVQGDRRGAGGMHRADMIITPSPSSLISQSPGNPSGLPVPSPSSSFNVPAPSPGSLAALHMTSPAGQFVSPQGMLDGGSPYPSSSGLIMPSPGQRNWPNSPSGPPSVTSRMGGTDLMGNIPGLHSPQQGLAQPTSLRVLPQRSWAASIPTVLSHDALERLLSPSPAAQVGGASVSQATPIECCPLERFLGCVYLRRHMLRIVQSEESITLLPGSEHGIIMFKVESGLHFQVGLNPTTMQSLRIKITPLPEYSAMPWDTEELLILEKFFDAKVSCPPYKPNPMLAFMLLVRVPQRILKDFIQIMKIELMPDRAQYRWTVNWCLTLPYGWPLVAADHSMGANAVVVAKKILFVLQLTRDTTPSQQQQQSVGGGQGGSGGPADPPQSVMVPILYDMASNVTSMMDQKSSMFMTQLHVSIAGVLKRFSDMHPKTASNESSIYPAIRDLLTVLSG